MKHRRTLILGDIHGSKDSLDGVLEIADYSPSLDRFICIGDYVDGWKQSFEVVDYLIHLQEISIHNNVYLLGNHDKWFRDVLSEGIDKFRDRDFIAEKYAIWYHTGGKSTYDSYIIRTDQDILRHKELFFDKLQYFHKEGGNLFVHAGFNPRLGFEASFKLNPDELITNRSLFEQAFLLKTKEHQFDVFDKIFIGHTPTIIHEIHSPIQLCNVINVDQGCKVNQRLSYWVLETDNYETYFPK